MQLRSKEKAWSWRPPRVRFEPPTVEEAMAAARDMTGDYGQQIEFAAGLMGVPVEDVKRHYPDPNSARKSRLSRVQANGSRTVVVERKIRRIASASGR